MLGQADVRRCGKCHAEHSRPGQRYCKGCHAASMREWRETHELNEDQKYKARCRALSKGYVKMGLLHRFPCDACGNENSEMHHEDYSKPMEVIWLCRPCHLAVHKGTLNVSVKHRIIERVKVPSNDSETGAPA